MQEKIIFFLKNYCLILLIFFSACSKSFSGNLIEKKNNSNKAIYISPDGKTFQDLPLGKKVDIQPYIIIKENISGIVIKGEYQYWKSISILGISLSDGKQVIDLECSKTYSISFFTYSEVCGAFLDISHLDPLKQILQAKNTEVTFKEKVLLSVKFQMSQDQKKAFNLILKKFSQI